MKNFLTLLFLLVLCAGGTCRADGQAEAVLREVNLARTHPQEYALILAAQQGFARDGSPYGEAVNFLNHTKPLPPLAFSNGLAMGAMAHVLNQGGGGATGHYGDDRSSPWERMKRFGKWLGTAGENISYGIVNPRQIVVSLIVDANVGNRGHRRNIFCRDFGVAGVACGPHARYGTMCVMDFAGAFVEKEGYSASREKQSSTGEGLRDSRG